MSIGRKHIYVCFCLEDAIYQPVLLGYLTTPTIFGLSSQWIGPVPVWGCSTSSLSNLTAFLKLVGSLRFNFARSVSDSGEKVILYIIIKH